MENLDKYGTAYLLPLPFKVTALRAIMVRANDCFDEWQQSCYWSPDALNVDTYQRLYVKFEDWARQKKLDSDTKNTDAMDIDEIYESAQDDSWDVNGWVDDEGYWWPDDNTWWTESDQGSPRGDRRGKQRKG